MGWTAKILAVCLLFTTVFVGTIRPLPPAQDARAFTYALLASGDGAHQLFYACSSIAFARQETRTLFLTAAHCFTPHQVYLVTPDIRPQWIVPVRLERVGLNMDLAVFSADVGEVALASVGHDPSTGALLSVTGWPRGMGKLTYHGNVVASLADGQKALLDIYLPGLESGMSGAALFCKDQAAVCGIVIGIYHGAPAFGLAEPISHLEGKWLTRQGD